MESHKRISLEDKRIPDGMSVPEGYFEDFSAKMVNLLPRNEAAENPTAVESNDKRSWWDRYRPYIYMAAMFAGVWCMTKMFSLMKENNLSFESNNITAALSNNDFVDDYVYYSIDEYDILDNLYNEGLSVDDLNN